MIDEYTPTPLDEVIRLTAPEREDRVTKLIEDSRQILEDAAIMYFGDPHELMASVVLFSGGNDSTVLLHLMAMLGWVDYTGHANTGIGIEETRQFVRDTSAAMGIPLLEKHPETPYRELVIKNGFPGPGSHFRYYQRLKERCLRQIRRDLVGDPNTERVLFIAGRRRSESPRRGGFRASGVAQVPPHEREGSTVWCSPLLSWTKPDMNTYRAMMAAAGDPVPVNMVTDLLHMSGECLCGCFSHEGELEEIRCWFPDVAADIDALMAEVAAAGHTGLYGTWGHGKGRPTRRRGILCQDCG